MIAPELFTDPELYDRQEAHGESRELAGEPDAADDEFWSFFNEPAKEVS